MPTQVKQTPPLKLKLSPEDQYKLYNQACEVNIQETANQPTDQGPTPLRIEQTPISDQKQRTAMEEAVFKDMIKTALQESKAYEEQKA